MVHETVRRSVGYLLRRLGHGLICSQGFLPQGQGMKFKCQGRRAIFLVQGVLVPLSRRSPEGLGGAKFYRRMNSQKRIYLDLAYRCKIGIGAESKFLVKQVVNWNNQKQRAGRSRVEPRPNPGRSRKRFFEQRRYAAHFQQAVAQMRTGC